MEQAKTKIGAIVILALLVVLVSVFVNGRPGTVATESKGGSTIIVPAHAVEIAPGIFSLGSARDVDGRVVEGFLFVDKRKGEGNNAVCGDGVCHGSEKKTCETDCGTFGGDDDTTTTTTSTCYSLFAKGASWKTTEPYITSNESGNEIDLVLTETSLETWDSEVGFNIFGTGSSGTTDGADTVSPDDKNEVQFESLGLDGTIAYAIVWGIFSGRPSERELVEWDVVFNSDYAFGDAGTTDEDNLGDTSVMDYQNIATHEFGHSLGLTHPGNTCTDETMYAFASAGETKKRTLGDGDVVGVNKLYS